jgi:hypothetical protein
MGLVAKRAAEDLLQSSRSTLAPLEELQESRGEFRRRIENNLSQLPGFDPAGEAQRRQLGDLTLRLVESLAEWESGKGPSAQQADLHRAPDLLVQAEPESTVLFEVKSSLEGPREQQELLRQVSEIEPRLIKPLATIFVARDLQRHLAEADADTEQGAHFAGLLSRLETFVLPEAAHVLGDWLSENEPDVEDSSTGS